MNNIVSTKMYGEWDDFIFEIHVVNFPFLVPRLPTWCIDFATYSF